MQNHEKLLTPGEAAAYLGGGVTPRTLKAARSRGELRCTRLRGPYGPPAYSPADLDAWAASRLEGAVTS